MKNPRAHRIAGCLAATLLLAACSSQHEAPSSATPAADTQPAAQAATRAVVEHFGKALKDVSVLAPADAIRNELHATYGKFLAPKLMTEWRAHPDRAIGREGSSPWPQRIEIHRINCPNADACAVTGDVDYITSNEVEHGGVFMRRAIMLDVLHTADGWRITAVKLAAAPK